MRVSIHSLNDLSEISAVRDTSSIQHSIDGAADLSVIWVFLDLNFLQTKARERVYPSLHLGLLITELSPVPHPQRKKNTGMRPHYVCILSEYSDI